MDGYTLIEQLNGDFRVDNVDGEFPVIEINFVNNDDLKLTQTQKLNLATALFDKLNELE